MAESIHHGCCGVEHDPQNGKLHGYCVVCGVPWPCDHASALMKAELDRAGLPPGSVVLTAEQVEQIEADAAALLRGFHPRPGWRYDEVRDAYDRIIALLGGQQ